MGCEGLVIFKGGVRCVCACWLVVFFVGQYG